MRQQPPRVERGLQRWADAEMAELKVSVSESRHGRLAPKLSPSKQLVPTGTRAPRWLGESVRPFIASAPHGSCSEVSCLRRAGPQHPSSIASPHRQGHLHSRARDNSGDSCGCSARCPKSRCERHPQCTTQSVLADRRNSQRPIAQPGVCSGGRSPDGVTILTLESCHARDPSGAEAIQLNPRSQVRPRQATACTRPPKGHSQRGSRMFQSHARKERLA